jgi:hypothetical protein
VNQRKCEKRFTAEARMNSPSALFLSVKTKTRHFAELKRGKPLAKLEVIFSRNQADFSIFHFDKLRSANEHQ